MSRRAPPPLPDRIASQLPAGVTRQVVRVDDLDLHVMTQGEGRDVLLLHGNPTWSFLWRHVFAALAGHPVRLVAPDLPGLGLSSRVGSAAHTLANHGRWMGGLIEALDLRDLVFVGQDWGGPIGLRALADVPERLHGLVILNTVVGPPRPGFTPTLFHRASRWPGVSELLFRGLGFPQNALHRAQGVPDTLTGDTAWAYRWPLRGLRRNAAPLALARMVPDGMAHPSVPELARCQALVEAHEGPQAIVWGTRDPILGRLLKRTRRLMPRATVAETSAGHFLQEEVPHAIAQAVRDVASAG